MISEKAIQQAAKDLGVDIPTIRAVAEVESKGAGFLPDGRVKILFEPHIFWKELKHQGIDPKTITGAADILYPVWGTKPYGKYSAQWPRMERAMLINKNAALCSASWGAFQVMGFNWPSCAADLTDFVNKMKTSEDEHLLMFVEYIQNNHLDDELQNKDWAGFARGYNGPAYTKNNYDGKLAAAYKKYLI